VASFSSRGPSPLTNETKPDVSAPGVEVRSAIPGNGYAEFNGTSMAAPHVTGAAALMLAADPAIDIDTIEQLLMETAVDLGPAGPDPDYGHGRIDAFAAVQRVVEAGAIAGSIDGDDTGLPIAGAEIQVEGAGLNLSRSSAADGSYEADYLLPGSYTVTVRSYGYAEAVITNVIVLQEQTTTVDVTLNALPRYVVNGYVFDAITTTIPISGALVSPLGTPLASVTTDATGWYSLTVAAGDLRLEAAAFSYATGITDTTILTNTQIDFYLDPLPPILLVDDDEGALRSYSPHVESHYLQALDANGYAYTYWDIEKEGSPTFDTIRQYAAVVWFGGEFGRI
ncbi:MAG: carboxypeptidase regulatory-like domain-containing protein, partial [Anaerolineales bacterium]|nr:carboxypeptidase regulatory-like domain-containing protein [Anaerolineales bacterium]